MIRNAILVGLIAYCSCAFGNADVGVTPGQFEVSLQGSANYSIPIKHTPGTAGMSPQLSLVYSSHAGPGPVGMGWSLAGVSTITRGPKNLVDDGIVQGIEFSNSDALFLDGQRILPVREFVDGTIEYRTSTDNYSKIISYPGRQGNIANFRVWTKAGLVMDYGNSDDSNIRLANGTTLIWANSKITDTLGNYIEIIFEQSPQGSYVVLRVDYTGNAEAGLLPYASIQFSYCKLSDGCPDERGQLHSIESPTHYINGQQLKQEYMLTGVQSYYEGQLLREYELKHTFTDRQSRFLLSSIREYGPNGHSFPPTDFSYAEYAPAWEKAANFNLKVEPVSSSATASSKFGYRVVDLNGDGLSDVLQSEFVDREVIHTWMGDEKFGFIASDEYAAPTLFSDAANRDRGVKIIDINGDSKPDTIWSISAGGRIVDSGAYLNTNAGWEAAEQMRPPVPILVDGQIRDDILILDANSDSYIDFIIRTESTNLAYVWSVSQKQYLEDARFRTPFETRPSEALLIDSDGDGTIEVLARDYLSNEHPQLVVYRPTENGWEEDDAEDAPPIDVATPFESIHVVDLNDSLGDELFISSDFNGVNTTQAYTLKNGTWELDSSLSSFPRALFTSLGSRYPLFPDVDGDGRKDVTVFHEEASGNVKFTYLNTTDGWRESSGRVLPTSVSTYSDGKSAVFVEDVNDDGLDDLISIVGGGSSFVSYAVFVFDENDAAWKNIGIPLEPPIAIARHGKKDSGIRFADLDGDGLVDMMHSKITESNNNSVERGAWRNTGIGWTEFDEYADVPYPMHSEKFGDTGVELVDVNGDGLADFVYSIRDKDGNYLAAGVFMNTGRGWKQNEEYTNVIKGHPLVDYKFGSRGVRFQDLNGDGLLDFLYRLQVNDRQTDQGAYINDGVQWVAAPEYVPPQDLGALFITDRSANVGYPDNILTNNLEYFFNRDYNPVFTDINGDRLPDLAFNHVISNTKLVDRSCQRYSQRKDQETGEYVDDKCIGWGWADRKKVEVTATYINTGTGWRLDETIVFPRRMDMAVEDQKEFILQQDINGDGLVDVVFASQPGARAPSATYLNTGRGWINSERWRIPKEPVGNIANQLGFMTLDLNGDGLVDVAYNQCQQLERIPQYQQVFDGFKRHEDGTFELDEDGEKIRKYKTASFPYKYIDGNCTKVSRGAYTNNGVGFTRAPDSFAPIPNLVSVQRGDLGVRFVDVTGDGLPDTIQNHKAWDGEFKRAVYTNSAFRQDIMLEVVNGAGIGQRINYKALGAGSRDEDCELDPERVYCDAGGSTYPLMEIAPPIYAVHKTEAIDPTRDPLRANGDQEKVTYQYGGFRLNVRSGESLGFAWRKSQSTLRSHSKVSILDQSMATSGIVRKSLTYQGTFSISELDQPCEDFVGSEQILTCSQNSWSRRKWSTDLDRGILQVNLIETFSVTNDLGGNPLSTDKQQFDFDAYGNVTKSTRALSDGMTIVSDSEYENNTNSWYLGRLLHTTISKTNEVADKVPEHSKTCFEYDGSTGLVILEVQNCGSNHYEVETLFEYDSFGNEVRTTVNAPFDSSVQARSSTIKFDDRGRFVIQTTNALGHTSKMTIDPLYGLPLAAIDPNGLVSVFKLNDHGDVVSERSPSGVATNTTVAYLPNNERDAFYKVVTHSSSETQSLPETEVWYSRRGYEVRRVDIGFGGKKIFQDIVYDQLNRATRTSLPYSLGEKVRWASAEYDELDRFSILESPDRSIVAFHYVGHTTYKIDQLGRETKAESDLSGRTTLAVDATGATVSHQYDISGRLLRTTNVDGSEILHSYDIVGNHVRLIDPDLGSWTYEYNALGELVYQSDAKGQETRLHYDLLGRLIKRVELGRYSEWFFDRPDYVHQRTNIGLLSEIRGSDGYSERYIYDEFSRQQSSAVRMPDGEYVSRVHFDDLDRVVSRVYPSGFSVTNIYDEFGNFVEVRDPKTGKIFWSAASIDSRGSTVIEKYGNGIRTKNVYESETGFLTEIQAWSPNGDTLNGFEYEYDRVGNVVSRTNLVTNSRSNYEYDALDRIVKYGLSTSNARTISYSANGNIVKKSDFGSYEYGAINGPAHGVSKVESNSGDVIQYAYDANGNMTKSGRRQLHYTVDNRVSLIKSDWNTYSGFSYSPSGAKYYQEFRDGFKQSRTYFLGLFEKVHETMVPPYLPSAEHIRLRHYIEGRDGVVAIYEDVEYLFPNRHSREQERRSSNIKPERTSVHRQQVRYLHKDSLGSLTLLTDERGEVVERFDYDPWGKRIVPPNQKSNYFIYRNGFTGHRHLDSVGLIHMNGRVYDPTLARFVSADPNVQDPNNSQNLNRYSYVVNNPLRYVDPSGFFFKKLFKGLARLVDSTLGAFGREFGRFMKKYGRQIIVTVIVVAVSVATYGAASSSMTALYAGMLAGAAGGAVGGALTASMYGGNVLDGALKGAIFGAITGALAGAGAEIGKGYGYAGAGRAVGSGVGSGISTSYGGGRFESGLLSGFAASYVGSQSYIANNGLVAAALAGGTVSVIGGGKFANGAVLGSVAYLVATHVRQTSAAASKPRSPASRTQRKVAVRQYKVIDSTNDALDHYLNGNGEMVELGPNTKSAIMSSSDQAQRLGRIVSGESPGLDGNYGVNIEGDVFHVGDTPVRYSTACGGATCTTTFTNSGDGFWDPVGMSSGSIGPFGTGDGIGPNGEFGKPYRYRPFTWKVTYPRPTPIELR